MSKQRIQINSIDQHSIFEVSQKMDWNKLTTVSQIDEIVAKSFEQPCVIFKHSTTCPISYAAKMRIDGDLVSLAKGAELYYLDLLSHRDVSNAVAEKLDVHHESPQVIVLKNGEVIYDESHLDISSDELAEQLA